MNKLFIRIMVVALSLSAMTIAGTVSGKVTDASNGNGLAGANVTVEGTSVGAAADANGMFHITNVPNGSVTITASMIGFEKASKTVDVRGMVNVNFSLTKSALQLSALEVLASRADAKTPVAYTNITKEDMEVRLGSQDIPMILNTTPSVYATQQGGGAGDARINVRGFNQRNVAVMINGVPQNDMENGWVYWSNWDGVGDATSSIQMQRGLSAVNLATPSIGGTMNIITDPTASERGGVFKQEVGDGSFLKTTLNLNTGLMFDDKIALSGTIVRKTGDGLIDKTWTDAWAYYIGASFAMNKTNRFELYAIGAPQRHGQNLYKQNIASYDRDLAKDIDGYDEDAFAPGAKYEVEVGREFNQNWAPVSSSYTGKQYYYMYGDNTVDRHDPNYINERENFFHKPLVNLNHYLTINDQMRLSSVLYWSGGSGGGTGTYGKIPTLDADGVLGGEDYKFYYGGNPWTRDWNTLIAYNSGSEDTVYVDKTAIVRNTDGESVGILRNSINRQSTIGLISKLNYDFSDVLKLQFGIDWRTADIEHAREVRDLMGGEYYIDHEDANNTNKVVRLGDIIAYHNETTVDWVGVFAQASYIAGPISAYGMVGSSSIKYSYQDHFTVADKKINSESIGATQFKGGAMFDVSNDISVFGNFGIVEKPPIMDNVIYIDGTVADNPDNEQFVSTEFGVNWRLMDGRIATKVNVYNTDWNDRNLTKSVTTGQGSSGDTDVIFLTGVDQNHKGIEIEASAQVHDMVRVDAALSFGTWEFVGDAGGTYTELGSTQTEYQYALDGLKVGDMPQTAMVFGATITPIEGLRIQALLNWYDDNYSDWSPDSRQVNDYGDDGEEGDGNAGEIESWETAYDNGEGDGVISDTEWTYADRVQVWNAPSYTKIDVHAYYDIPVQLGNTKLQAFVHIFNLFDEVYIQDAVDNSQYNGWGGTSHDADNAEVFLGTPRYINAGINVRF
ncbi:MAG: TonB-dependent receptor [Candidatus Marinimicrobia bacterium]|jgi:outer membrane cobalamin receptor|nr:TonB-dependent receptor [Candidatus Neomarinimicrobiota bacterium]MBT3896751.1 TonB-dependent receptor [Candidatus Neomarinimicrobiota bacterium]MBT4173809.1 TonB-dependent receptor [Candidatus Neomarinimicrobiota bacterium]MBT5212640.1 TonB-dependent receptor [Candidatus Neomarinimicrobiota bacterium]MBT5539572.1 TonB-dependent receptor [Candidatus Neomarinimicrobiota bacterium]